MHRFTCGEKKIGKTSKSVKILWKGFHIQDRSKKQNKNKTEIWTQKDGF